MGENMEFFSEKLICLTVNFGFLGSLRIQFSDCGVG